MKAHEGLRNSSPAVLAQQLPDLLPLVVARQPLYFHRQATAIGLRMRRIAEKVTDMVVELGYEAAVR